MDAENVNGGYRCIVNLKGFTPSWVAGETGHWPADLAYTNCSYKFAGVSGEALKHQIGKYSLNNCKVYH